MANSVATRKAMIQNRFRAEMGLLVDMPKQSAGNTNDGNTARRFFRNTEPTAAITGLHFDIIHRFRVILEILTTTTKSIPKSLKNTLKKQQKDTFSFIFGTACPQASIKF